MKVTPANAEIRSAKLVSRDSRLTPLRTVSRWRSHRGNDHLLIRSFYSYVRRTDATRVSDEERRRLGIPTLEESRERLRTKNNADKASLAPPPVQVKTQ